MSEIKVGSKWVFKNENRILEVLYVDKNIVFFKYLNGNLKGSYNHETINMFLSFSVPYKEYKWFKLGEYSTLTNNSVSPNQISSVDLPLSLEEVKQHEILFNYHRYREQFDNVQLDWRSLDVKYYIWYEHREEKYYAEPENRNFQNTLGLYFSTEEHAKTFIELLKENVNE